MNRKSWESDMRVQLRGGFALPFIMVIIGLYWIFFQTPKLSELDLNEGIILDIEKSELVFILLENNEIFFKVDLKKDKEIVSSLINKGMKIKIWSKNLKNGTTIIKQLEYNGDLVINYNWFQEIIFSGILVLVGVILIPFVLKDRKKHPIK